MTKLLKKIFSRTSITALLIVIQVVWLVALLLELSSALPVIQSILRVLSVVAILFVIRSEMNPSYKIGWVLLISILPLLGGLMFVIFGNKRPTRYMRKMLNAQLEKSSAYFKERPSVSDEIALKDPAAAGLFKYLEKAGGYPAGRDTKISYYRVGEEMFEDLICELEKAEKFIFLEYFIISPGRMWDSVLEILKRKASEGVDVRVIYDDMGCIDRLPANYCNTLRSWGIKTMAFNRFVPAVSLVMNNRDHRKLTVIDGKTGFTGGINISDEYINEIERFGHWKDTAVQLRGSAVRSLTRMFLQQWTLLAGPQALKRPEEEYLCSFPVPAQGFVQPYADTPLDSYNVAESAYLHLVQRSNRYVYITTPYLILDNEFVTSLKTAAESGVDVRIITPSHPDKWYVHMVSRSYYQTLIQSGVKIYEYQPGFIHAKMFLCDDQLAVVGTANLDYRSLYLHFENAVLLYHCPVIADIRQDFADTLEKSRLITLEELRSKLRGTKLLCALLKLLAPLM